MTVERLTDDLWVERCVACMVRLDPQLEPALAEPLAVDLCSRSRWRGMAPEDAARVLFDVGKPSLGGKPTAAKPDL